jgi:hypothetical protein
MGTRPAERIVSLQKQLTVAKRALEAIAHGDHNSYNVAVAALENMMQIEIGKTHAADATP